MTTQSTVNYFTGFGVVGEPYSGVQVWAQPAILNSGDAANNVFGRVFTFTNSSTTDLNYPFVQAGGTGVFAGYLINPKAHASYGTSVGGPLAPTLTLANQTTVEIAYQGEIIVTLPAAANIGDLVVYNTTTGVLTTVAPGADLPVGTAWAYAYVNRFKLTAASLAVIKLDYQPTAPVAP